MAAGEPDARTGAAPRSAVGPGVRTTDAPPGAGHGVHGVDQDGQGRDGAAPSPFAPPTVSLPKGGGAVRGIGEKFSANPVTGTGSLSVPIFTSPGRSGFGPQLALSYDSGAGNGPFGFGWQLGLPAITRKTDKGLPRYLDAEESDTFILSGAEDLVPVLVQAGAQWQREALDPRLVGGVQYRVQRYRPRVEGLLARIERWTKVQTGEAHWRSISKDNVTTLYGQTGNSRIADPADPARVFSWLMCASYDDKGNAAVYEYLPEDTVGVDLAQAHEQNREKESGGKQSRSANRYLKRIRYGNRTSWLLQQPDPAGPDPAWPDLSSMDMGWCFEVVFDYGEGQYTELPPDPQDRQLVRVADPAPTAWPARRDPFSSYRAGFEVRTYRLCRRVLMLHHFPDALNSDNYLVRSTEFSYAEDPVASFITTITQSGYVHQGGGIYLQRSLPPLELEYSRVPSPEELASQPIHDVDAGSLENLPAGLDGSHYQWVDLDGEGLSGVLTEQADAWFYKPNLGGGQFGPMQAVPTRPSLAALGAGRQQLLDLAGDGQLDLAQFGGPVPGFFERTRDERWEQFIPFASLPRLAWDDPNLRFVDLTGDGHADVLVTEDEVFTWYPSLAESGFGPSVAAPTPRDEELGPRLVFADATQSIFVADMSGDGLTDLVRVRNGEVCYWPNLGYGRFGAKVTMDDAPWFDAPDLFDQRRVRLADIDGSGTSDIVYLAAGGEARLYCNQAGNAWSQARALPNLPPTDNLSSVTVVDLLGSGTACLVWSSPLPGQARRPMRYLDLMGGTKPHLLVSVSNNLGAQTQIHYAPSTKFYLADKRAGTPWATRLPFPVHVVERVETFDLVSRNHFVTAYAYHHGHFDGVEREFRGFGMVEQSDTEQFAALRDSGAADTATNLDAAWYVPPVRTKTWFHTGALVEGEAISRQFQREYWRESDASQGLAGLSPEQAAAMLLDDTVLPTTVQLGQGQQREYQLTADEAREAARALKGSILRQEVYALDAIEEQDRPDDEQDRPYSVAERNYTLELLQPQGGNRHAVFLAHPRETVDFHYERTLYQVGDQQHFFDPRVSHALTLQADEYGNPLQSVAISYGRRFADPDPLLTPADRDRQQRLLLTLTENRYTNAVDEPNAWRAPLPCEARSYELLGLQPKPADPPPAGITVRFGFEELTGRPDHPGKVERAAANELAYQQWDASVTKPARRLIEHVRTLYRANDLSGLLPLGTLKSRALPGKHSSLAFTPELPGQVYRRGQEELLPDPSSVLGGTAGDQGGFESDGGWWVPSGLVFYAPGEPPPADELLFARGHFFLPQRFTDPFGNATEVTYDEPYRLLVVQTTDPVGNTVGADHDYRVLQPERVTDPNGNRSEVAFDALGLVAATAVMGKLGEGEHEGDVLEGFEADLAAQQVDDFFDASDPHTLAPGLLGKATTRVVYDLDRFRRTHDTDPSNPDSWMPAFAATLARETHVSDPGGGTTKIQLSFDYSDGFGREIQKKIQAEPQPGLDPNWVGSGWTIFNNKGKPVRQYEPFFSTLADKRHRFEFARIQGVSRTLFYDPVERVVATLHPNHSYEKVVFDPWQQATWDVNDTVATWDVNDTVLVADPRTDPDVGGFFRRLPEAEYLPTWHALRIDPAHAAAFAARYPDPIVRAGETQAAQKTQVHAGTPAVACFDTLGRTFLTVAHNRFERGGGVVEERYPTRVELDIEGNQHAVRDAIVQNGDALGRIVMRYAYDLLGNRIHQASMEAGERWLLNDVTGKPTRSWTSRGHAFRTGYDRLRRPLRSFVEGGQPTDPSGEVFAQPVLFERVVYGEQHPHAEALNLRGRPFLHLDSAGVVTNHNLATGTPEGTGTPEAYDFKGNLLHSTRRLARDYTKAVDWSSVDASLPDDPTKPLDLASLEAALEPLLEEGGEHYLTSTAFDALNRPTRLTTPDASVILPAYNEANLLERVDAHLQGAAQLTPFVTDIDYNAKGQRTLIKYAGEVGSNLEITTTYDYDEETFRLIRLTTKRGTTAPSDPAHPRFPDDCPEEPDPGWPGCGLQDLHYTYDPAGDITHIRDDAQQKIFFRQQRVEPSNDYTYDAIYRLIQATGREHLGQNAAGARLPPTPTSYNDRSRLGLPQPNDRKAMGTYQQRYVYDEVGNLQQMIHVGTDPSNPGWTRTYFCEEDSLLEPTKRSNRLTRTIIGSNTTETYSTNGDGYDAHGNMLGMPQLQAMQWNFRDQLRLTQRQKVNDDDPDGDEHQGERTWYVYDAAGQRVRKVTVLPTGQLKDERIYLGAFEVYRRHDVSAKAVVRQTLHIMDDKQRIALVETRTQGNDDSPARLIRYQLGNHLGSVSLELDQEAKVISYEEYYPYGSTSYQAVRSQTETPKRYRYIGKERDDETQLAYHGARYYASWLGRWTAPDPSGLIDGSNLFLYARANPVSFSDGNGYEPMEWARNKVHEYTRIAYDNIDVDDTKHSAVARVGYGLAALGIGLVGGAVETVGGVINAAGETLRGLNQTDQDLTAAVAAPTWNQAKQHLKDAGEDALWTAHNAAAVYLTIEGIREAASTLPPAGAWLRRGAPTPAMAAGEETPPGVRALPPGPARAGSASETINATTQEAPSRLPYAPPSMRIKTIPASKTIAEGGGSVVTVSGPNHKIPGIPNYTSEVAKATKAAGGQRIYPRFPALGPDYNDSHAEAQAAMVSDHVKVTKDPCPNCTDFTMPSISKHQGVPKTAESPSGVSEFHPNGDWYFRGHQR